MNIPWKLKSFAFKIIDLFNIPGLLYFLQKYVTGRSRIGKLSINPIWESHKNYLKQNSITLDDKLIALLTKEEIKKVKNGDLVKVKGRFIGYDELFEELRMDQCIVED